MHIPVFWTLVISVSALALTEIIVTILKEKKFKPARKAHCDLKYELPHISKPHKKS